MKDFAWLEFIVGMWIGALAICIVACIVIIVEH